MNTALLRKTAHDHFWVTCLVSIAVLSFPVVILLAFSSVPLEMIEGAFQVPWISTLIRALTGAEISELLNANSVGAFVFVHPVVLTITWGFVVMTTSRVICGEVDQGTADVLLSLPLSRWSVYTTVSTWVFLCCLLLIMCLWCGVWIGVQIVGITEDVHVWSLHPVAINACALLWAVAGIGMLFSAAGSTRGAVVGTVAGILVASFLLNSLAAFWPRAQAISFVSIMHYFRPFVIILEGRLQTAEVIVLLSIAAATWTAGGIIFSRRDIHTT
ncbi:MAG: ABC transporter permease subunit [Phycisphaerae bacterium]